MEGAENRATLMAVSTMTGPVEAEYLSGRYIRISESSSLE